MPLDHLWATWRSVYINQVSDSRTSPTEAEADGRSLFERILMAEGDDDEKHILVRREHCFVLLNRFPYTSGHLMVLPNRAEPTLEGLSEAEQGEMWSLVREAVVALKAEFGCEGVNVGINLGIAAGGSQADHLHVHCVPRWVGDANFVGVIAETRVLPISLDDAWSRLKVAWP